MKNKTTRHHTLPTIRCYTIAENIDKIVTGWALVQACNHDNVPAGIWYPEFDEVVMDHIRRTGKIGLDLYLKTLYHDKQSNRILTDDFSTIEHKWIDMQPNDFCWPMMSARLRDIIETNLTGEEGLTWVDVLIKAPYESRTYYIPWFTKKLDVLDMEKTVFLEDGYTWGGPVFNAEKIQNLAFFDFMNAARDWEIDRLPHVSHKVRLAVKKANIPFIRFAEAPVTYSSTLVE